ncbi:hypothetical protein [Rhizobium sp. Rhizsp82]|uniref:hypothetical protein n=1 Tax=Rhizobium sp. Rhizsp82 TaxID=3243057 RepID=UPI0039B3D4DD
MARSIAVLFVGVLLASPAWADEPSRGSVVHNLQDLRDAVDMHWSAPPIAAPVGMRIKVRFNLDRSGAITGTERLQAIGADPATLEAFTGALIKAVRDASPFSGFPDENYDAWKVMDLAYGSPN